METPPSDISSSKVTRGGSEAVIFQAWALAAQLPALLLSPAALESAYGWKVCAVVGSPGLGLARSFSCSVCVLGVAGSSSACMRAEMLAPGTRQQSAGVLQFSAKCFKTRAPRAWHVGKVSPGLGSLQAGSAW